MCTYGELRHPVAFLAANVLFMVSTAGLTAMDMWSRTQPVIWEPRVPLNAYVAVVFASGRFGVSMKVFHVVAMTYPRDLVTVEPDCDHADCESLAEDILIRTHNIGHSVDL